MQQNLLTDVDGPLFDWATAFQQWASPQYGPLDLSNPDLNYCHEWLRMPLEAAQPVINSFQTSDAMAKLPAFPDALAVLPRLADRGFRITAVSGCGTNPIVVDNRWRNLRSAFGDIFADFIPLPHLTSKRDVLAQFKPGIWIEDAHYHAQSGHDLGHRTFLMHRNIQPINTEAGYEHVTDWHCVYNRLIDPTLPCC